MWSRKFFLFLILLSLGGCSSWFFTKRVYMMYRVKEGDTLSKIADQYQWSMNQLVALNKISNPNVLEVDQLLLVPSVKDASRDPHQNSHWVQEDQRLEDLLLTDFVTQVKGQLAWPLRNGDGRITSVFGKRRGNFHEGVDIGAPKGTPVYSTAHGKVIYSGTGLSGYGKLIVIKHEGFLSAYAHNRSLYYERGDWVEKGVKIAEVGNSGRATGTHLHFELRVRNSQGNYVAVNPILPFG